MAGHRTALMIGLVVVASVAGAAIAMVGTRASGATIHPRVIKATRHPISTKLSAGIAGQQGLLEEILSRVDSDLFTSVAATPPPAGFGQFPPETSTWLAFTTSPTRTAGSFAVLPAWEAMLVAGAYRDLSASHSVPADVGLSTSFENSDGSPAEDSGGEAVLGPTPSKAPTNYTEAEITKIVESNIGKLRLKLQSIRFIEPNRLVPIVVATTDNPSTFVRDDYSLQTLFGDVSTYEGVYVEVRDSRETPVAVVGVSTRIDQVTRWIRADLAPSSAGDAYPNPAAPQS